MIKGNLSYLTPQKIYSWHEENKLPSFYDDYTTENYKGFIKDLKYYTISHTVYQCMVNIININ